MSSSRSIGALGFGLAILLAAAESRAGGAAGNEDMEYPRVGGHVGAVLPLVQVDPNGTRGIGDFLTVAIAAGVTVVVAEALAVDFETVVAEPIKPKGLTTGLTIDPGVIYDFGPIAVGARIAYQVAQPPNIGVIPLLHRGFSLGRASWFLEADFPVADVDGDVSLTVAVHLGVSF
jgi:hypothetical protein